MDEAEYRKWERVKHNSMFWCILDYVLLCFNIAMLSTTTILWLTWTAIGICIVAAIVNGCGYNIAKKKMKEYESK